VQSYLKTGSKLYNANNKDIMGNDFGTHQVDKIPNVPADTFTALSDVAPGAFWSPFKGN
jgi:hypothetical protein